MTEIAITVSNISKCFKQYRHPADRLKEALWPRRQWAEDFWALKGIDLTIFRGQTLGIVGRNGSGKSTLLQVIAGTLTPTTGHVEAQGRISALLELGSGFNPEFTGRQNIFFNGRLLGLTQPEIEAKYDSIVAFADIGEFIHQPVKTYSSGMYVRLGFAVATSVEPDILIIDEALSVGDEAFQRKCFSRLHEIQDQGGTILFVSHAATSVTQLCDSAILMDRGEMLLEDTPKMIISKYQKMIYAEAEDAERLRTELRQMKSSFNPQKVLQSISSRQQQAETTDQFQTPRNNIYHDHYDPGLDADSPVRYPSRGATISDPHLLTLNGQRVNHVIARKNYVYTYTVEFSKPASHVRFGMLIKTVSGFELAGASLQAKSQNMKQIEAGTRLQIEFKFQCLLAPDVYFLNAGVSGIVDGEFTYLDRCIDVAVFRVQPCETSCSTAVVDLLVEPQLTITSSSMILP